MLGLVATLNAKNKDVLVEKIEATVVRASDNAKHDFEWSALIDPQVSLSGLQDTKLEQASPLVIRPGFPIKKNILFWDPNQMEEIRSLVSDYNSAFWQDVGKPWYDEHGSLPENPDTIATSPRILEKWKAFLHGTVRSDTYARLNDLFFWREGEYEVRVSIVSEDRALRFVGNFHFKLSEGDSKTLRLNIVTILDQALSSFSGMQSYPWNWNYPRIKRLNDAS